MLRIVVFVKGDVECGSIINRGAFANVWYCCMTIAFFFVQSLEFFVFFMLAFVVNSKRDE